MQGLRIGIVGLFVLAVSCATGSQAPDDKSYKMARALYEIGKSQFSDRQFAEAINTFQQSLKITDDQSDAKTYLALAFMETGKFNESEEIFKHLCNGASATGECFNNYSALKLREKQPDAALELATRALKTSGYTSPEFAVGNQAKAWSLKGNYVKALEYGERAEKLQPANCEIRNFKTQTLIRLKKMTDALQNAKLTTMQCPIDPGAQVWEAYALYKIGRHPQARDKFEYIMNEFRGSEIGEYSVKALEKIPDQIPVEEPPL